MAVRLIALLIASQLGAATLTVCASGCSRATIAAALADAACGDVVELLNTESHAIGDGEWPRLACPQSSPITLRTSAFRQLPAGRISRGHSALAVVTTSNSFSWALRAQPRSGYVTSVSTGGDTLTVDISGWIAGEPVVCGGHMAGVTMPGGIAMGTVYFVRSPSGSTFQLAATPGGAAIDITSAGSAGATYYDQPSCSALNTVPSGIRIRGIDFQTTATTALSFGSDAVDGAFPRDIEIDQVVMGSASSTVASTVKTGVYLAAIGARVSRSYFGYLYADDAETKCVTVLRGGNVTMEDNYCSASGLGVLIGGTGWRPWAGDPGGPREVENIVIRGNTFEKGAHMLVFRQTSDATGACLELGGSGAYWRNTTSGDRWRCAGGTWTLDNSLPVRTSHLGTKSGIEFKRCVNCVVEGNIIRGAFASEEAGQAACMNISSVTGDGISSSRHGRLENVVIRGNWCDQTWTGIRVSVSGTGPSLQSANVAVVDNLVTGVANCALTNILPCNSNDYRSYSLQLGPVRNNVVMRNTVRTFGTSVPRTGIAAIFDSVATVTGVDQNASAALVADNLSVAGDTDGVTFSRAGDGFVPTCTGATNLYSADSRFLNNAVYSGASPSVMPCSPRFSNLATATPVFIGAATSQNIADHGQASASPYSAACSSGCQFAATDGGDLGADIPALRLALDRPVIRATATAGALALAYREYSTTACTAAVFGSRARASALASATDSGAWGQRTASLSVSAGRRWWTVTCGTRVYGGEVVIP